MSAARSLIAGLVLILLGAVLLAANLDMIELEWLWLLKFLFPLFFLAVGIAKLVRHFTWSEEEVAGRPGKTSLLSGVFWSFLGAVLMADLLGVADTLTFLGRFWPLILILFGSGKVIDFYRFSGRFQVRPSEIFGLIFIMGFGLVCNRLANTHFPLISGDWRWPVAIDSVEPRHRFEQQESYPAADVRAIVVRNVYGDVRVEPGSADSVEVRLTKVIRQRGEDEAAAIADRVRLISSNTEDQLVIGTNREELGDAGKRLNTHMVLRVPAGLPLVVTNGYGSVSVRGIKASCRIENNFGQISVTDLTGDLEATTSRQRVEIRDVTGQVHVNNDRGAIRLERITGPVEAVTSYEALEALRVEGDVTATNRLGRMRFEQIGGTLTVEGTGSSVHIRQVDGDVVILQARSVDASRLMAGLRLDISSGEVELSRILGLVEMNAVQTRIEGRDLEGGVHFKGEGTQIALSRVAGDIRIETTLRDVRVDGFSGSVDVQNEYGAIRLDARADLTGSVVASNRNGEIVVSLPASASFELSAQSRGGQIVSEFGEADSTRDLSVLRTTVGEGGPRVELQTTHSRIRIRKRG